MASTFAAPTPPNLRKLPDQPDQADRTVSVGTLTSAVAREFENPLSYVTANLAFVAEEMRALSIRLKAAAAPEPELAGSARQIADAAADALDGMAKMRRLVGDLRTLSRRDDPELKPLDPTHVLESCIDAARSETARRARVERALARSLAPGRAHAARLSPIFLDLLVNAAHTLPEGHSGEHLIRVRSFTAAGPQVVVEVRAGGVGVPSQDLQRILEAGFGTGAPGAAARLGLSTCRGLVEGLGGELQVESRAGQGTIFRVLFPVAQAELPRVAGPAAVPSSAHGERPRGR
jgi:signal transduction histidine kinase